MKWIGAAVVISVAGLLLAGCSSDNNTTFVLQSGSGSASGTASASASVSAAASGSPGSTFTGASPTAIPDGKSRIIIDSPDGSSPISSPVQVSGTASVDHGTVVAVVLDASGTELGRGTATASASKPDWGHYNVSVSFNGAPAGGKGQLKVFGVRADGTTPTYYYFISVRFP